MLCFAYLSHLINFLLKILRSSVIVLKNWESIRYTARCSYLWGGGGGRTDFQRFQDPSRGTIEQTTKVPIFHDTRILFKFLSVESYS